MTTSNSIKLYLKFSYKFNFNSGSYQFTIIHIVYVGQIEVHQFSQEQIIIQKLVQLQISLNFIHQFEEPEHLSQYRNGLDLDFQQAHEIFLYSTVSRPALWPTKPPNISHWKEQCLNIPRYFTVKYSLLLAGMDWQLQNNEL